MKRRVLTGITTTGSPHLGNYVGAIRPAIAASTHNDVESFYFLADYHALVKCQQPEVVHASTLEIAATWLALGLDPEKVFFYRQSDIPEIPELTWMLSCVAGKGLLNRAHAYKAAVDANIAAGHDADAGISMGLFMYPVLMAADILVFNAHDVPVGRDQIQHIEIARDLAQRFNYVYGKEYFVLPEALIADHAAILPGLDGRKMSKSYGNTIPLWLSEKQLRAAIMGIVTNSQLPGEAKHADESSIFTIYQAFASTEETAALREAFAEGISWGDAKQQLFERINQEIAPARAKYARLVDTEQGQAEVEKHLQEGARKVRERAGTLLRDLRHAVGLRPLTAAASHAGKTLNEPSAKPTASIDSAPLVFKSYREQDGKFYFKILAANGTLLVQSHGFASPKETGQLLAAFKNSDAKLLSYREPFVLLADNQVLGSAAENCITPLRIGLTAFQNAELHS